MPITADQRAALQLVLERGQTCADLSAMLDIPEADVRERARSALEELAGANPDRNVGLTDYLLGQADPIDRADVVRHLREDPDDHRLATTIVAALGEVAPAAELPRLPGESRAGRFLRRGPATGPEGPPATGDGGGAGRLTRRQSQLLVGLSAAAVLLVAVVLGIAGVFGSGDGEEADADEPAAEEGVEPVTLEAPGETLLRGEVSLDEPPEGGGDPDQLSVPLEAVGGGDGNGEAVFGLTGNDQLYAEVDIRNLEQAGEDETHVLWLMLDRQRGFPLTPVEISANGRFDERVQIPPNLLPVLAQMRFVTVELTADDVLAELLEGAIGEIQGAQPEAGPGTAPGGGGGGGGGPDADPGGGPGEG